MANRFNINAGDWNTDANWSTTTGGAGGASFPIVGDDAIFDSNSGNCTLDANAACDNIVATVAGAYASTFNAAGFDMDVGGNCELNAGTWTLGSGTWFVGGGMQHASCTNWIGDGATIDFDGTGSFSWTQINDSGDRAANIIVRAGVTLTPASLIYATNYDIYGTIPLGSGSNNMQSYSGYIKVHSGGTISGTGSTYIRLNDTPNNQGFLLNEGSVSASYILFRGPDPTSGESAYLAPGTYNADVRLNTYSGDSGTAKYQLSTVTGSLSITGDLWLENGSGNRDVEFTNVAGCVLNIGGDLLMDDVSTSAGGVLEFDNSANNQTMTISGDMTLTTLGTGTVTFTESAAGGDIVLDGTLATFTDSAGIGSLGDVTIAANADLALASNMEADDFIGSQGCTVTGVFVLTCDTFDLTGVSGNPVTWTDVDVTTTAAGTAAWSDVSNSAALPGADITADANSNDNGGNDAGWIFELDESSSSATSSSSSATSSSSSATSSSSSVLAAVTSTNQLMLMGMGT